MSLYARPTSADVFRGNLLDNPEWPRTYTEEEGDME